MAQVQTITTGVSSTGRCLSPRVLNQESFCPAALPMLHQYTRNQSLLSSAAQEIDDVVLVY